MESRTIISLAMALMCAGCAHQPPTSDEATREYTAHDYDGAFKSRSYLAQRGDATAEYQLGLMYSKGQGVQEDETAAFRWMIKSAGTGYVLAELATAQMYRTGMGVLPDWNEAMKWYSLAAGQGNAVAENDLGSMYIGIPASAGVADAAYWYRRAADAGYVVAEINLAGMYMRGIGVPYDPSQAIIWYCKAAAQESIDALLLLGQIYRYGRGIPEDDALAQQMFQKAADHVCMSREQCASEMRAIINAHKAYPSDAVQARVEGASVISFDYKGGKPLRIHVDRSSGYVSLDKAAIAAVGDSLFPVLGSEMKTASHFQVEVDFTLDAPGFLPGANSPP